MAQVFKKIFKSHSTGESNSNPNDLKSISEGTEKRKTDVGQQDTLTEVTDISTKPNSVRTNFFNIGEESPKSEEIERNLQKKKEQVQVKEELLKITTQEMEGLKAQLDEELKEEESLRQEQELKRKQREEEEVELKKKIDELKNGPEQEKILLQEKAEKKLNKMRNKKGFLVKRGRQVRTWKTRYFVIREGKLYYFTDSTQNIQKGCLPLFNALVRPEVFHRDLGKEHTFLIHAIGCEELIISAPNEKEKKKWIEALQFVAKEPRESQLSIQKIEPTINNQKRKRLPMQGWLEKQGKVLLINPNPSWKRRWFILKDSNDCYSIEYFEQYGAINKKGEIYLKGSSLSDAEFNGRDHCFQLKTIKKIYLLSAPTEEEYINWKNAIKAALDVIDNE